MKKVILVFLIITQSVFAYPVSASVHQDIADLRAELLTLSETTNQTVFLSQNGDSLKALFLLKRDALALTF